MRAIISPTHCPMPPTPSARATDGIVWPDDERRSHFERWLAPLASEYALAITSLAQASADASSGAPGWSRDAARW
jgi:hypothetical protein